MIVLMDGAEYRASPTRSVFAPQNLIFRGNPGLWWTPCIRCTPTGFGCTRDGVPRLAPHPATFGSQLSTDDVQRVVRWFKCL